jgi:hypothetical protein
MPWIVVSFIELLLSLDVLGLIWWVSTQLPLPPPIPRIVQVIFTVICAIVVICWLLSLMGAVQIFPGPGYSRPLFGR